MKHAQSTLLLVFLILAGLIIGGLLGELAASVPALSWLNYGKEFGIPLSEPLVLDLGILKFKFAMIFHLNIASIIGLMLSLLGYKLIRL